MISHGMYRLGRVFQPFVYRSNFPSINSTIQISTSKYVDLNMYIIIEFIFILSGKKVLNSNKENIAAEGGFINDEILKSKARRCKNK